MAVIKVSPMELGAVLRADAKALDGKNGKVIRQAMLKSAEYGRARLVQQSVVDRGMYKASWQLIHLADRLELLNTAPYAGVIERGVRPGGKYGRKAIEAIKNWVIRQGMVGKIPTHGRTYKTEKGRRNAQLRHQAKVAKRDQEAEKIAWAIIKKLEKYGRKGSFKVQALLPKLVAQMARVLQKEIAAYFAAGGGKQNV